MTKLDEYLRISEAAEYVGVAPNTLRNWGKCGKITEIRHPLNGYRLYARDELDAILRQVDRDRAKSKTKRRPR